MRSHVYSLMRTIMASAERDELIGSNPCKIVGAGTVSRAKLIRPATVEQLQILADAMPERLRLMVLLSSWCALRFGEVVELRRKDIDLGAEVIRIRRAAARVKGTYEIGDPKTYSSIRDVYIPENIIPAIEHHLERFVEGSPDALLFPNDSGGNLQPSTVNRYCVQSHSCVAAEGRFALARSATLRRDDVRADRRESC